MNISQAKLIDIGEFLEREGHKPVKNKGKNHWYLSPIRSEHTPSFKVDSHRNEWYDYGLDKGGDILDLVKELYHVRSTSDALAILEHKGPAGLHSISQSSSNNLQKQDECQMRNIRYCPLTHQALLSYIMKRKIDIQLSRVYCCEVHYDLYNKHYFGIAFRNRKGGYEIRNPYYKGCIGHKDITVIKQNKETIQEHVIVFEGLMDFLSYQMLLTANNESLCIPYSCDYIVLNSINCLDKALGDLQSYQVVHSFLDNDDGGRRTFEAMKNVVGDSVIDESHRYKGYNDLNDFLAETR